MHRISLRPSPALVVACLALVLALGGVAWARSGSGGNSQPTAKVIHACVQPDLGDGEGQELSLADESGECPQGAMPIAWNVEGRRGQKGKRGPKGDRGARGARGPKGTAGAVGPQGAPGPTGAKGDVGAPGAQGETGPQGRPGPTGPSGPRGETGATGAEGQRGPIGPTGAEGPPGVSGYEVVTGSMQRLLAPGEETVLFAQAACPSGKKLLGGGQSTEGGTGLIEANGPVLDIGGSPTNIWEAETLIKNPTAGSIPYKLIAVAYCAEVTS